MSRRKHGALDWLSGDSAGLPGTRPDIADAIDGDEVVLAALAALAPPADPPEALLGAIASTSSPAGGSSPAISGTSSVATMKPRARSARSRSIARLRAMAAIQASGFLFSSSNEAARCQIET